MSNHKEVRLSLNQDNDNNDAGLATVEERPKLKEPAKFQVVIMNDDFTPMEFVVEVLETFFLHG
jgi:ATP-dependent Clp protease adaptor protein ClpS